VLAHITRYCESIFTTKTWRCERVGLAVRLRAGCSCTALDFLFASESLSELHPGTAVVFSPATLVERRVIVDVGVDRWVVLLV
jgi:hypothetical protein